MNVKDLISVLSKLPGDSEVKMYLFSMVGDDKYCIGRTLLTCDVFELHDVLVASYGKEVYLSSHR